jgi:hypothetical protein
MDFELDHVFVCVSEGGGPEAEQLAGLGLLEGEPNRHPGQGTACRRFFLANAYLELLWVHDPGEVQGPLRLWERWSGRSVGASPFGVCLRPSRPGVERLPFPAWQYRPAYLPAPLCIHVAEGTTLEEPSLFHLAFSRRPDSRPEAQRQPLDHPGGFHEVTRVLVRGPQPPSPAAEEAAQQAAGIGFQTGEGHLLEVGLDGECAGLAADLRPLLPLLLRW